MIVNKYANGGGGSASGVTPQEVQAQIDSALTYYWESGETKDYVDEAVSGISLDGYWTSAQTESAITEAVAGKADAKILVDFDHTTQAERAAVYAELKALYDGGSGATINKNYDFYKTVNTWQGQKIDYYTFSGGTLVFGQVVSPENLEDQVAYVQVMEIDSAGNVTVQTNTIGAADMSEYYTSAQTEEKIASAVTPVAEHLAEVEQVASSGYNELHTQVLELSARTAPDLSAYYTSAQTDEAIAQAVSGLATEQYVQDALSGVNLDNYWTSAQTEDAISAATSGKADAASVSANTNAYVFPTWNEQGVITGTTGNSIYRATISYNGQSLGGWLRTGNVGVGPFYAPTTPGTAGEILVSTGNGAPVWSAVTMGGDSTVLSAVDEFPENPQVGDMVSKNYAVSGTWNYEDETTAKMHIELAALDTEEEYSIATFTALDGPADVFLTYDSESGWVLRVNVNDSDIEWLPLTDETNCNIHLEAIEGLENDPYAGIGYLPDDFTGEEGYMLQIGLTDGVFGNWQGNVSDIPDFSASDIEFDDTKHIARGSFYFDGENWVSTSASGFKSVDKTDDNTPINKIVKLYQSQYDDLIYNGNFSSDILYVVLPDPVEDPEEGEPI